MQHYAALGRCTKKTGRGSKEKMETMRCGKNKFVRIGGVLMSISEWWAPWWEKKRLKSGLSMAKGALVQRLAHLNCRQDQLDLLMQYNEMASSGKKGSSTQLLHAEYSLIWLNNAVLTLEKIHAYATAHTPSMNKSQFVYKCYKCLMAIYIFLFSPFIPWISGTTLLLWRWIPSNSRCIIQAVKWT